MTIHGPATGAADIRAIGADEAFPLRHGVLRPALPPSASRYPLDEFAAAVHLGMFVSGMLVSVGSFLPEALEDGAVDGVFRLRGMVTLPDRRRRGHGGALLARGIAVLALRDGRVLWCNGRTGALTFYRWHGFEAVGEEFVTPGTGPHFRLVRALTAADRAATQSPQSVSSAAPAI